MVEVTPKQPVVRVGIVYNSFKPEEVEWHELPYQEGATVRDYVGDMAEGSWTVGYKGEAYEGHDWETIVLPEGAAFSFVQVPEGGGSSKDILRIVALIAVMVVALAVVGPWASGFMAEGATFMGMSAATVGHVAAATFTMAGMMAVNALIPPAGIQDSSEGSSNYGIDGPKNTAKEGPVVPVGFGEYWFGGNVVDSFTKLEGQTQYLYIRTVLNDGPIDSVSDFRINGEVLANFKGVQTRVNLGSEDGEPNDWFGEAIRMQTIGVELDPKTGWTTRTTNTDVDRVRVDLLYPEGLGYWKDDGKVLARFSGIEFRYRRLGETAWRPLTSAYEMPFVGMNTGLSYATGYGVPTATPEDNSFLSMIARAKEEAKEKQLKLYNTLFGIGAVGTSDPIDAYGDMAVSQQTAPDTGATESVAVVKVPSGTGRVTAQIRAAVVSYDGSSQGYYSYGVYYREQGTTAWVRDGAIQEGAVTRSGESFPLIYRPHVVLLDPSKRYEMTVFGGVIENASALISQGNGTVNFNKAEKKSFRYTYDSGVLPRGRYEVSVRRTVADDDNTKSRDSIHWTDLAEIDVENIHYVGTANVSLKIRVDDQIKNIPQFICKVKASTVNHYDIDGNITEHKWSPYPCWHFIDVLLNQDRGRGLSSASIDWQSILEWERHCIENDLRFNAPFDAKSNVWDVTQKLLRVGHAQLVRQGTKYGVAIDKRTEPVQIFNDSNIIEGTFSTVWLGLEERANELHYTYYPTDSEGKEEMLRVVDPVAMQLGEEPRVLAIQEQGVTNRAQAMFNIEKQLRENRLLKKTVSFDAPLEAISLTIGDVAIVQHSSAHYGKGVGSGLLKAGSTASRLMLDSPIKMEQGRDYRILTTHDAIRRYTVNIERIVNNTAYVSGLPDGSILRCRRLRQGANDIRIEDVIGGSPHDRIILSDASKVRVGSATLWDTDVIEERSIVFASGEVEEIDLVTPLSGAPATHARWIVGPVELIKAPYRLRSISGDDIYRRSLKFVEYNDAIYDPLDADYQPPKPVLSTTTAHVRNPSISWPPYVDGQTTRVTVKVAWEAGDDNYAGADLYIARNGAAFEFLRSVQSVTSVELDANLNDDLQVRIVAFGKNTVRQIPATAPVVGGVIYPSPEELIAPTITELTTPVFKVDATVRLKWAKSPSATVKEYRVEYAEISAGEARTGVISSAAQWKSVAAGNVTEVTVAGLQLGFYAFRVRGENGRAFSPWATQTYEVEAPELPQRVTGLRLDHAVAGAVEDQFVGSNAKFVWNDVAASAVTLGSDQTSASGMDFYWRDYIVRIKTTSGALIREEITRNAFYEYTLEKNKEDCRGTGLTARRAIRIEVSMRGRQGQESSAIGMNVSNPSPLPPALLHRVESVDSISFAFGAHSEPDVEGMLIWAKETSGFTPTVATADYRGPDPFPTLRLKPKKTYYVRYAAYDAMGTDSLRFSDQITVTTSGLTNDYFDESFYDGAIPADVMAKILLIDGDGTGSVNERLSGVRSEIESATAALNQRIDTVTSTGGNRVFYQTAAPVATSGNDLWINPNDNNRFKRWNGIAWEYVDDARVNAMTSYIDGKAATLASDIQAVANQTNEVRAQTLQRNRTFRQSSAPTSTAENPLAVGDLWYDTANGNKPFRWGGASVGWQETSDNRFTTLAASIQTERDARVTANDAMATEVNRVAAVAQGKNQTYRQNTQPTNPVTGDLWIDTTNLRMPDGTTKAGNVLKRWSGTAWVVTNDPRIDASAAMVENLNTAVTSPTGSVATQINTVSAQANAKNKTFFQATAPATTSSYTLAVGDIWIKSNESNKQFRWSGSAWQAVDDARIGQTAANLTAESTARANADSALGTRIDTVSATAGSAKATAEAQAGAIAELSGKAKAWASRTVVAGTTSATIEMKAETDGKQAISSITLLADEIGLGKTTDGSGRSVLRIRNGQTEINGTLSSSAGIFLGSGTTVWPVALRNKEFVINDGVPLDFGVNLGTVPQYEISPVGLAPLNAGESYDLRLNNLTGSGCTPYLKINVPAVASSVTLTTDTFGASGEPTRIMQRGSNAEAPDGNYTMTYKVGMNWEWYSNRDHALDLDMAMSGGVVVGIWKKTGGIWVKVAERTIYLAGFPRGVNQGWNSVYAEQTETAQFQLGSGVQTFGVNIVSSWNDNLTASSSSMLQDLVKVEWQVRGQGANVRSATPSGFQGRVTIRPQ